MERLRWRDKGRDTTCKQRVGATCQMTFPKTITATHSAVSRRHRDIAISAGYVPESDHQKRHSNKESTSAREKYVDHRNIATATDLDATLMPLYWNDMISHILRSPTIKPLPTATISTFIQYSFPLLSASYHIN